jgi:hypothetical protein
MKKILVAVVLIAAGIYGFKVWDTQQGTHAARLRAEGVVRAMADNDQQTAIGLWSENREKLDMAGLEAYQLRFQTFWSDSGLSSGSGWVVTAVEPEPGRKVHLVTPQSGNQQVVLRVPPDPPITVVPRT